MPENSAKVDRSTRWGNPFKVDEEGVPDAATAVRLFRKLLADERIAGDSRYFPFTADRLRADLGGKNLACWCPLDGTPCHADVLLEMANSSSG